MLQHKPTTEIGIRHKVRADDFDDHGRRAEMKRVLVLGLALAALAFPATGQAIVYTLTDVDNGLELDSGSYGLESSNTLAAPLNPTPSFQVGYDSGESGETNTTGQTKKAKNIKTKGNSKWTSQQNQPVQIPEPGTAILLGGGLIGLFLMRRRARKY
jgi:hypothetical protein